MVRIGSRPGTREFVARELFEQLARPAAALEIGDLRNRPQRQGHQPCAAAAGLKSHAMTISRMERGLYLNAVLTTRFRQWLKPA